MCSILMDNDDVDCQRQASPVIIMVGPDGAEVVSIAFLRFWLEVIGGHLFTHQTQLPLQVR